MNKSIFHLLLITATCNFTYAAEPYVQQFVLPTHAQVTEESDQNGTNFLVARMGWQMESLYIATMQDGTTYAGGYHRVAPFLQTTRQGLVIMSGKQKFIITNPEQIIQIQNAFLLHLKCEPHMQIQAQAQN